MKSFALSTIFLFTVLAVAFAEINKEFAAKIRKAEEVCEKIQKIHVDKVDIEKLDKGQFDTPAIREKYGKHELCIYEQLGGENEDGTFNYDVVERLLELGFPGYSKEVIKVCRRPPGETAQELALDWAKCMAQHIPAFTATVEELLYNKPKPKN